MIQSTVEMFNNCHEINGWAFWTWKKAPTKHPGLSTIRVPDQWQTVMAWLTSLFGKSKPEPVITRSGMARFLQAMKFKNTDYDRRMEKALFPQPSE